MRTKAINRKSLFLQGLFLPLFIGLSITMRGETPGVPRLFLLQQVIDQAKLQSPAAKNVENQRNNAYWYYRNFKTSFRPSLSLYGNLPNFRSTNSPVTQPDGSVSFRSVNFAQSTARLTLNQEIAATGTSIFVASELIRIDDFNQHSLAYNSSPFMIGFNQPIFGFNSKRWSKKIEPLKWEESEKGFFEEMETVAYMATQNFFQLLSVQTAEELAQSNLKNSQANLEIAKVKIQLGKISQNDFERINLSVYNARKAMNRASMDRKIAEFNLKSFIGFDESESIQLIVPLEIPKLIIDLNRALQYAKANRKEVPQFERMLLEAERDQTQAKRNNGLTTYLTASYGLTTTGARLNQIVDRPETQKIVSLSFNIPILDWGRSASQVEMADSRYELVKYKVDQQQLQFEREVIVQTEQFMLIYEQIETSEQASRVAENGYQIALKQYQNGNLSITDLNIALQEREQSRRDYIGSLSQFWQAYYKIRMLTLYDFENGKPLVTENKTINK